MVGSNIGGGEWLFGPIVAARHGGQLMWIATVSLGFQIFYNLAVMRYTLYSGEPIFVGFFRTSPGPKFWGFFLPAHRFGGDLALLGVERGRASRGRYSGAPARPGRWTLSYERWVMPSFCPRLFP